MIIVKRICLGSEVKEYDVTSNPTIAGLLEKSGDRFVSGNITINHRAVEMGTPLRDGDSIYIGNNCKGNQEGMFQVKLIRLGSSEPIITVPAEHGMTINDILNQLSPENKQKFFNADGTPAYEYRIDDSEPLSGDHEMEGYEDGQEVRMVLSQKTKGNKIKSKKLKTKKSK